MWKKVFHKGAVWNLEKRYGKDMLLSGQEFGNKENEFLDTGVGGACGANWSSTDMDKLPCKNYTATQPCRTRGSLGALWKPRGAGHWQWEGGSRGRTQTYTYSWSTLLCSRSEQHSNAIRLQLKRNKIWKMMWHIYIQWKTTQSLNGTNQVTCSDVDAPRVCHTEWRKSEIEKRIAYINILKWNLEKQYRWTCLQGRKRAVDTQKGFVRQGAEGADGRGALTWTNYRVHHRQLVGSCHTPQGARLEALRQPPGLRRRLKSDGLYAYSQLNHADAQHKPTALESIYPSIKNKL